MSPPSTVQSELFSDSMTSVDTSQSEDTLQQGAKSGTSQTTSMTVNMAVRTWSRRSDSSTIPPKGVKLVQQKTPVVSVMELGVRFSLVQSTTHSYSKQKAGYHAWKGEIKVIWCKCVMFGRWSFGLSRSSFQLTTPYLHTWVERGTWESRVLTKNQDPNPGHLIQSIMLMHSPLVLNLCHISFFAGNSIAKTSTDKS